jgi:hypothetical protein
VGLGYQGPDAYLKNENGNPVPETVRKADTKMIRFLLELERPAGRPAIAAQIRSPTSSLKMRTENAHT